MANIIDSSYFVLDVNVPDGTYSILDSMITRYEHVILEYVLGPTLYKLMVDNASDAIYKRILEPHDYEIQYMGATHKVYWNGLTNADKISLLAYYVYVQWVRNGITTTLKTGEIKSISENSEQAPVNQKIAYAWRLMRELVGYAGQPMHKPSLYNLLTEYESDYPTWLFTDVGRFTAFDL